MQVTDLNTLKYSNLIKQKVKYILKKKEKMTQALLVQDVAKRHYQIRFKSFPKQKKQVDVGGGGEQFNLEELNRRRKEAKLNLIPFYLLRTSYPDSMAGPIRFQLLHHRSLEVL